MVLTLLPVEEELQRSSSGACSWDFGILGQRHQPASVTYRSSFIHLDKDVFLNFKIQYGHYTHFWFGEKMNQIANNIYGTYFEILCALCKVPSQISNHIIKVSENMCRMCLYFSIRIKSSKIKHGFVFMYLHDLTIKNTST